MICAPHRRCQGSIFRGRLFDFGDSYVFARLVCGDLPRLQASAHGASRARLGAIGRAARPVALWRRMRGRKPAFDNARRVAPYCAAGFGEECKWTTDLAAWGRVPARFGLEKGSEAMTAFIRPSLILRMDLDERLFNDECVSDIKRSYSYVAPSLVQAHKPVDGQRRRT